MRTASLADFLSSRGHNVIWWTSSFVHYEKKYVCREYRKYQINDNETMICLHSPVSYKKNISLRRIIYHKILGHQLEKHMPQEEKPDIILCCWPLAEFAEKAIKYGKNNNVPVILDARDQWPDIFMRAFPRCLCTIGRIMLLPLKKKAQYLFSNAYGITAMVNSELEWACQYAGRAPSENDRTIYIGNDKTEVSDVQFLETIHWWNEQGVYQSDWIICFFSTFGSHIAIDTVIRTVKILSLDYADIKLVLGGGGDREEEFKAIADNNPNIIFAGWLDNIKMTCLMRMAKCGAFSIKNTSDFKDTFNNKAIQYISEGLPILNSLSGFAKTLISEKEMGLTYDGDSLDDCKEKILCFYNDEELRKRMGDNGLSCFYEMFESKVVNKQFEEYLITMCEKYYG